MNSLSRAVLLVARAALKDIAVLTATASGSGVDITDYEGALALTQMVGTVSGTTPTLDGKIETSDASGSGYATAKNVAAADALFAQVTASNNTQTVFLDCDAQKKFLRYTATIAGTTPSFAVGCLLSGAKKYV
jgi:hypothetical protein